MEINYLPALLFGYFSFQFFILVEWKHIKQAVFACNKSLIVSAVSFKSRELKDSIALVKPNSSVVPLNPTKIKSVPWVI